MATCQRQLGPTDWHPQHPGGACLLCSLVPVWSLHLQTGSHWCVVWATPGCTLLDTHTHTHVYIYVLLKSGCFAITGTIFPTGEHLTTSEQSHYHTVTSMLSVYWSSFGNHSIWEKVLHYRKPREEAMQRSCNVKRLAHVL